MMPRCHKGAQRLVQLLMGLFVIALGSGVAAEPTPLRVFIVADAHVGNRDRGERYQAFAALCNLQQPDAVIDLGDAIQGQPTSLYDFEDPRDAALKQQADWARAWHRIAVEPRAIALGNRDVHPSYPLEEEDWLPVLGYTGHAVIGGTRLQHSFVISNEHVSALIIILCMETYRLHETVDWVENEAHRHQVDHIIMASHRPGVYGTIRDRLLARPPAASLLFLHGHYHGPDTLVRDRSSMERTGLDFPIYMVTDLMRHPVAVELELCPVGYTFHRWNLEDQTRSAPIRHDPQHNQ